MYSSYKHLAHKDNKLIVYNKIIYNIFNKYFLAYIFYLKSKLTFVITVTEPFGVMNFRFNGFRNIFPIYYEGKHIGVIEISFSFAINILFKQDNDAFSLMINKDIANTKLNVNNVIIKKDNFFITIKNSTYL